MNERKNLDRLFQEKFKDFEVAPPEFVWENIREALEEKKKRRAIPLWIRLSGVAAVLLVSGVLATLFFNESNSNKINTNPVVLDTPATTPNDPLQTTPNSTTTTPGSSSANEFSTNGASSTNSNDADVNTAVANSDKNSNDAGVNTNNATTGTGIKTGTNLPVFTNKNNAVAHGDNNTNSVNKNSGKKARRNKMTMQQGEAIVVAEGTQNTSGKANKNNTTASAVNASTINKSVTNQNNPNEGIANTNKKSSINNQAVAPNNTLNEQSKQTDGTKNILPTTKEGIANNANSSATSTASDKTAIDPASKQGNTIIDKNISATEAIAQTAVDSTKTIVPENELEKLLREKMEGKKDEDKSVAEKSNKSKWNVKPQVAPIFYNSLSDGSPINEQFASNNKSYDNDMSLGIGINYALSDRITIRTGINTVNLNYATNDIAFHASLTGQTSNIIETRNTANIVVQNANNVEPVTFIIDGQPAQTVNGSMMQKTGYLEVPLEMSYALVNKKFGIDVIGGVSTLFLNQNNVSVVSSEGLSTQVGQAENLNNIHFSTNIGIGFKYRFWDSFQANFEPMFKYQVNTFSRDAGNFKPYFIGLYSGVSFSF